MKNSRIKNLFLVLFLISSPHLFSQNAPENSKSAMGINIEGVIAWQEEFVYVNLAHQSMPWKPFGQLGWDDELEASNIDENGYLLANTSGELPVIWDKATPVNGDFVCTWANGNGATVTLHTYPPNGINITNQTSNRIEFSLINASFLFFQVQNADNPVSNVRITEASKENTTDVFYPAIYETWRNFTAIRFMDLLSTNNSPLVSVADYTTENSLRMEYICPEYIAHLCERLNADAWVCIPHQASDALVQHIATELNSRVNLDLNIYVEYSNEVWNGMFEQNGYAAQMGGSVAEWQSLPDYLYAGKWYGRRSKQIFDIFESVFGSADRLVRVISWQGGMGAYWQEEIMYVDDVYLQTDAYAISFYFGYLMGNPQFAENDMGLLCEDVDDVFEKIPTHIEDLYTNTRLDYNGLKDNPDFEHIELYAYEGGQHLVSYYYGDQTERNRQNELFMTANRDPRMKDVYLDLLDNWRQIGGKLFMNFSGLGRFSEWGSWAQKEVSTNTRAESPKYDADLEWINSNPVTWEGKQFTWDETSTSIAASRLNRAHLMVYPNPVPDELHCQLEDDLQGDINYSLYTITGERMRSSKLSKANSKIVIPMQDIARGAYILKIQSNQKVYTAQIFKK